MDYTNNRKELVSFLESNLRGEKLEHSFEVELTAIKLALIYGVNKEKAGFAGLMHDVTKQKSNILLATKYNIKTLSEKTLHGHTAAAFLKEQGICNDEEILNAIKYHTTARANMTLLEKIIYIADYVEPLRDFRGVKTLRKLAFSDIDQAVFKGLEMSLQNIIQYKNAIDQDTIDAYNDYAINYKF